MVHVYPLVNIQKKYGKSPFLMGKSTISMAISNSYFDITRGYQVYHFLSKPLESQARDGDPHLDVHESGGAAIVSQFFPLFFSAWGWIGLVSLCITYIMLYSVR